MHELSICQSLITQVTQIAEQHHARYVKQIHISVGPLSGIEPQLLQYAFPFASTDTIAEKAGLTITPAPLEVECEDCKRKSQVESQDLSCRHCRSCQTRLVSGDELMLTRVELETLEE